MGRVPGRRAAGGSPQRGRRGRGDHWRCIAAGAGQAQTLLWQAQVEDLLAQDTLLQTEVFGPLSLLVGLFNAFLIVVLRIPDMLATLASLFVI
ncbi:hypothetical protein FK521_27680, partial [Klebsiella pneumoniae]|nr:hypothetical protein [Klebsiella pneumoniae]